MLTAQREPSGIGAFGLICIGLISGVVLTLLLDPKRGAARRARLLDQSAAGVRHLAERVRKRSEDLQNRLRGLVYEAQHRGEEVPDDLLVERVRAQLGRPVSHPRLIEVRAQNGRIILLGNILAREVDDVIERLTKVRGVKGIDSQLRVYESEDEMNRMASLQGAERQPFPQQGSTYTH